METLEAGGGRKKPKNGAAAAATSVEVEVTSNDDLLREILVRFPDTASLVRAALACKRWRRVASDPSLLRRFHSIHGPPPLLAFIMSEAPPRVYYDCEGPNRLVLRIPSRNPHLAAAAAAADFRLKDFTAKNPRSGSLMDEWLLRSYDDGLLLLSYGLIDHEDLAVYDPIARTADFFHRPDVTAFKFIGVHYALVVDDGAAFRVFAVRFLIDRIMGAVFDSRTGEWAALPTLSAPYPWNMRGGMRAGRFAYWQSNTNLRAAGNSNEAEHTLVFDTIAMEWTLIQVPFPAKESYCVADMAEHGGLCLVASKEQTVQLWVRENNRWMIKKEASLLKEFELLKKLHHDERMKRVRILAVRDGYIYMEFWSIRKPNSYLLVLNWETMELSVHANRKTGKYRGPAFPFFMKWAPPLLSPAEVQALDLQGLQLQQGEDKEKKIKESVTQLIKLATVFAKKLKEGQKMLEL
ncbi:hypothetical protein U9M48_025426 [Paspalum notatum var. saurae]|uniref:F-box domain-containing protein n=1 Tax=Paspalum notatum var. saurae TaxID=547442 RepID=A0AAQ3TT82_PASNO